MSKCFLGRINEVDSLLSLRLARISSTRPKGTMMIKFQQLEVGRGSFAKCHRKEG